MNRKQLIAVAAATLALLAGCGGDCNLESCGNGATYQSCVEGDDLVIRDASGKEFSRCDSDYETVGGVTIGSDRNDCAFKHAVSKDKFCEQAPASNMMTTGPGGRACWIDGARSSCTCDNRGSTDSNDLAVSTCNTATLNAPLRCETNGTKCLCYPMGCGNSGGDRCYCGYTSTSAPMTATACTGYEWYCAKDDGSGCHGGNGNFGSACGNNEHNVSSCTQASVIGSKNSCQ